MSRARLGYPLLRRPAAALGAFLALTTLIGASASQDLDRAALERLENLSESLANDLLELSVATRDRDAARIASHWADTIVSPMLPGAPAEPEQQRDWLWSHDWTLEPTAVALGRDDFLDRFGAILAHFGTIEDARFKVKESMFEPGDNELGTARVEFKIVGRDGRGRREWMVAWLRMTARGVGEGRWQIERVDIESMRSTLAERDLFDEVALPAGVGTHFPNFGTAPNDTVIAHGPAVADVDNDGLVDLLTTGVERNVLYLNDGDGGFVDVSESSLLGFTPPATSAVFFDADNDGDQDLFMASVGGQMFLENRLIPDGVLRFFDVSLRAGVDRDAVGFSVAVADVNSDGLGDVYVASYNRYGLVMPTSWHQATNGTPNLLFINQGDLRFREAGSEWGVRDGRWSYAAAFADIDGDADQDLYVANDFGENGLYLNEGGRFRDVAAERGVLDPGNGMGVSFGDFDNDGSLDLHVSNMSSTAGNRILSRLLPGATSDTELLKKLASGNSIYRGDGEGGFTDATQDLGGISAGWAWGGGFFDFDNDGWQDVYTPNGFISGKTMDDT